MMAFNDFALANEGLAIFKAKYAEKRTDKNRGAQMYFVRLQASHLDEAMKIVDAIASHERLRYVVARCSESARSAFDRLLTLRSDKTQKKKFEKFVGRIRNKVTFHYDESGKLVRRAMDRRAKNTQGNLTSITRGTEPYSWRFKAGDDVIDSIVCREIWKIPEDTDLQIAADAAADYGHTIFMDFAEFASDLVTRYVRDGI